MGGLGDLLSEILKKYGLRILLSLFGMCLILVFAVCLFVHWIAAPGAEVSVLWGFAKYTKGSPPSILTMSPSEKKEGKTAEPQTRYFVMTSTSSFTPGLSPLIKKVTILPSLSQKTSSSLPELFTNSNLLISSPAGLTVKMKVKLKLWVGPYRVPFSDNGLYDGTETWLVPSGLFTGLVDTGSYISKCINDKIGGSLNIPEFLDANNSMLPKNYKQLDIEERIRARLYVKYPEYAEESSKEVESASLMYFLKVKENVPSGGSAEKMPEKTLVLEWVPDPKGSRYPKDAFKFDD